MAQFLKCFKRIAPQFLSNFSRIKKPPFETWQSKAHFDFEYLTILWGYLWAELFDKQYRPFGI